MNRIAESFRNELMKLAAEKKKKKKGSIGKALAIGAGSAGAINLAKGFAEKTIEPRVAKKIRKVVKKIPGKRTLLRGIAKKAPWAVARSLTGAAASVGYTLATLKAIEAARGK